MLASGRARKLLLTSPAALGLLALAGCATPPLAPPETPIDQPTQWVACPWQPGDRITRAECATVIVPLRHGREDGERFRLHVKRRPAADETTAQVWLVSGGPGDAATAGMERLSGGIYRDRPGIAHYAVDHRGTGGSERLDCPGLGASPTSIETPPAAVEACGAHLRAELGPRLDHVTLTASVHDLANLIAKYRKPRVPVFVYGASYGTIVVQRYLQLYPDQPDGVILEAIATGRFLDGYDAGMEETGRALMRRCAADPSCARRFRGDPWRVAQRAVARLDQGACPDLGATATDARILLGALLFSAPLRDLTPAVVARLDRCGPADVAALTRLSQRLMELTSNNAGSDVLGAHVFLSEVQPPRGRADALLRAFATSTMATGLEAHFSRIAVWPRSGPGGVPRRPPHYDGPILMLQGGLDAPSPFERVRVVRDAYRGPNQTFALFPTGAHGMTGATPTTGGLDCGRHIRVQFLDAPNVPPDLGCIEDVSPIAWDGSPDLNRILFGEASAWGRP